MTGMRMLARVFITMWLFEVLGTYLGWYSFVGAGIGFLLGFCLIYWMRDYDKGS